MRLSPYSAYKSSGVEWLGEVPAHWEVLKLKHWLTVNQQTLSESTDPDFTFDYVDIGSVGTGQLVSNPERLQFRDCPSRARRVVRAGDTILSMVRTYLKAVWHANKVKSDLVASTGFAVLTPKPSTCAKFVSYLCQSEHFTNRVTANSVGIAYPAIAETKLETFEVGVPPLYEQNGITRFLDHASDQIERYIRVKEKLIALLDEQKQVMIHDAVTGRIDVRTGKPYPAYKPSGIEWLGEVPAQWEIKKLKYLTKFINGFAFKPSDWRDRGIPIIRIENLNGSTTFNYTDQTNLPKRLLIRPGDIVFAWSGNRGTSFGSFRWGRAFDGYLNQHIFKLVEYTLHREYFFYLLRAVTKHVEDNAHGIIGLVHITKPALGSIAVALASSNEQGRIASWLDEQIARIKGAINQTAREIALLKEYRTRLIADVVTGKLDVREAAANLPELEAIGNGDDEKISAEPDSQQSNTTLHNEAPPTTPGVDS